MPRRRPPYILPRDSGGNPRLRRACGQVLERAVQLLPDTQRRICVIASPGAREGRTSLALNLASVAGGATRASVLVVDADSRAPRVHDLLGLSRGPGLSDVLTGAAELTGAVRPLDDAGKVSALTVGSNGLDPTSLSDAKAVQSLIDDLRSRFEWVFVDTAPLLTAPSGAVLARLSDGVIYAARYGRTRGRIAEQGLSLLEEAGARTLGVVLTQRHFPIPSFIYNRL